MLLANYNFLFFKSFFTSIVCLLLEGPLSFSHINPRAISGKLYYISMSLRILLAFLCHLYIGSLVKLENFSI
jgi:hypothetical protein